MVFGHRPTWDDAIVADCGPGLRNNAGSVESRWRTKTLAPERDRPSHVPRCAARTPEERANHAEVLEQARIRAEHVLETATGFRDGPPARARPGEPQPAYDPALTTLTERGYAKAAEVKAIPVQEALGLNMQRTRVHVPRPHPSGGTLLTRLSLRTACCLRPASPLFPAWAISVARTIRAQEQSGHQAVHQKGIPHHEAP